jgi:endonuclease-3
LERVKTDRKDMGAKKKAGTGMTGKGVARKKKASTGGKPVARKKKASTGGKPVARKKKASTGGKPGVRQGAGAARAGQSDRSRPGAEDLALKAREIDKRLTKAIPETRVELDHANALELLVATILAAQCTDKRVNQVTGRLFEKYRKPEDYLAVPAEELEEEIRETGYFRQKTRSIRGAMAMLVDEFESEVPADMDGLTSLPGVGRKTANVILGNSFDVPGIIVDTHVTRVSKRLGLTSISTPDVLLTTEGA